MTLYEKIGGDVKRAMKEADSMRVSVLRMVISDIKKLEIEKNLKSIDDDMVLQALQKHSKQHKESIDQFEKGARKDLADKEAAELKILAEYMPEQLTTDELLKIVKDVIGETGAASKNDTGRVMKAVMEKAKGKADGKAINQLVQQFLK